MAAKKSEVSVEPKATPLEAGEPQEDIALSQMGGTFAERQKARAKYEKSVGKSTAGVEDKAVKKSASKAKKKS